ncbi:P-loop NTPase fold protein [Desulfonatronum parangueonense]
MPNNRNSIEKNINGHVVNFLNYYCNLTHEPEYAVMLKGKWGCGKTWFVKKYLEVNFKDKYLLISLYGVKSYREIEDLFFQKLHPFLSSKKMALAGKILKGALKATIKLELDKKGTTIIDSQIPDIELANYFNKADGKILVFDDLERCCINIQDILGYINHFVEHQGFKAIIICNEDDIEKDDEQYKRYLIIKEKLVGKTFEIQSDVEEIITNINLTINNDCCRELLNAESDLIINIFDESGYKNIRILKQSIYEFERFFASIDKQFTENSDFKKNLLKLFLVLSFEIKSGSLSPQDLKQFSSSYLDDVFKSNDSNATKSKKISDKYTGLVFYDHLIDFSLWELFFDKGIIDKSAISESLTKNKYFYNHYTDNWMKLWHYCDLEDLEFTNLFDQVSKEFSERKHKEVGVVKHIVGMFLHFSNIGLIERTKEDILNESKKYIDELKTNKLLAEKKSFLHNFFEEDSWGSFMFMGYTGL